MNTAMKCMLRKMKNQVSQLLGMGLLIMIAYHFIFF